MAQTTNMISSTALATPPEILLHIVDHCNQCSWRALALVSRRWSQASTRRLYRTVCSSTYLESTFLDRSLDHATVIYNLRLFHRTIGNSSELCSLVVNAYLAWDEATDAPKAHAGTRPGSQMPLDSVDPLHDVANMLGRSDSIRFLHLTLPRADSPIPFQIPVVTSLWTGRTLHDMVDGPDYGRLMQLFRLPTLRHVQIGSPCRWNCSVPSELQQRGMSEVHTLALTHRGPPGESLGQLLSWMKDLRSLHIKVVIDFAYHHPYGAEAVEMTEAGLLSALDPQKEKLQEVFLQVENYGQSPYHYDARKGFRDFSALKRLNIPVEVLLHSEDECSHRDSIPPIHEDLPSSLQELVLQLEPGFSWSTPDEDDGGTLVPSLESLELLDWLSDIPQHKARRLPGLRKLTLLGDPLGHRPSHQSTGYPLECEPYTAVRRRFGMSNVELCFI